MEPELSGLADQITTRQLIVSIDEDGSIRCDQDGEIARWEVLGIAAWLDEVARFEIAEELAEPE